MVLNDYFFGNALNRNYQVDKKAGTRKWRVRFNDWMSLQPGGVLLNRAQVTKLGIGLGQVTLVFVKFEEATAGIVADQFSEELVQMAAAG